jgi:hypothetical protein
MSGSDGLLDILTEAFPSATADQIESACWRLMARADTQRAEAEKHAAVNILRHVADRTAAQLTRGEPLAKTVEEAMSQAIEGLRSIAERIERDGMPGIESGEVTLP